MASETTRVLSIRVKKGLYTEAADVAAVSGLSMRDLVERGLAKEIEDRKSAPQGGELVRALDVVRSYREKLEV